MLTGLILRESLMDDAVLPNLRITKKRIWPALRRVKGQPFIWHAWTFEADDENIPAVVDQLARMLRKSWYVDASTTEEKFIIYPEKVFRYRRGDVAARQEAVDFGHAAGIPPAQLDWPE